MSYFKPILLDADESIIELVLVAVFVIIGVIAQAIKKANERRQEQRRNEWAPRHRQIAPREDRPQEHAAPHPELPPAQAIDVQPEFQERLRKLKARIDQQERHLANMKAQQQELLQLLDSGQFGQPPLDDAVPLGLAAQATAATAAAAATDSVRVRTAAAAAAQPAGPLTLTSREQLRRAMIHREIFSPPVGLRQDDEPWDRP